MAIKFYDDGTYRWNKIATISQSTLIKMVAANSGTSYDLTRKLIYDFFTLMIVAIENGEGVNTTLGLFYSEMFGYGKMCYNFELKRAAPHPLKARLKYSPAAVMMRAMDKRRRDVLEEQALNPPVIGPRPQVRGKHGRPTFGVDEHTSATKDKHNTPKTGRIKRRPNPAPPQDSSSDVGQEVAEQED